jgi:hypothetical protein
VRRSGTGIVVTVGPKVVAEAVPATLALEPAAPVSFDEAESAARRYPWTEGHPFPECFVCGPDRAVGDGLRVFPGAVDGRQVAAAPWVPGAWLGDGSGRVPPEIVWAALDCPSWFGMQCFHPREGRVLLGRLAAQILRRPQVGERCVCVGWFISRDERKIHCGAALYSESEGLLGLGKATWIVLR